MSSTSTSATSRAWGVGTTTVSSSGVVLDAHFRRLGWGESCPAHERDAAPPPVSDARRGVEIVPVVVEIDTTIAPRDTVDVYLRLHLLSHRLAKPRSLNLDGVFGLLPNVAWTSIGPVALDVLDEVRDALRRKGEHLTVNGVDKFPRMTDY
ncbi:MAG: hypothetical protein RL352_1151, partial [Actinomycetota bacterium]